MHADVNCAYDKLSVPMACADGAQVCRHWAPDSCSQDSQAMGAAARRRVLQTGTHPPNAIAYQPVLHALNACLQLWPSHGHMQINAVSKPHLHVLRLLLLLLLQLSLASSLPAASKSYMQSSESNVSQRACMPVTCTILAAVTGGGGEGGYPMHYDRVLVTCLHTPHHSVSWRRPLE